MNDSQLVTGCRSSPIVINFFFRFDARANDRILFESSTDAIFSTMLHQSAQKQRDKYCDSHTVLRCGVGTGR
ncbi:MAG: hypothetical protein EA377_00305 [Phycisphaerales bacterium]|nr:MAG: hypothetical protein EA377_00305 [Phycisphaerales bacterium]